MYIPRVVGIFVTGGSETTTPSNDVEVGIWLIIGPVTPIRFKVPALPTLDSTGYSVFGASFWGLEYSFDVPFQQEFYHFSDT